MAVLKLYTMILAYALVYGQGDIPKGLESVEMVREGDIFEAEVAMTGPSSVEVAPGEDASLFCRVEIPYKFCNFVSPKVVTYSLEPYLDYVHEGRISFAGSGDPSRVCGIKVGQVRNTDNGEWRCKVTVVRGGVAREFSGGANITVHGVAREFSGGANITVHNPLRQAIQADYKEILGGSTLQPKLNSSDSIKISLEGVSELDGFATDSPAQAYPNIPVNLNKITRENHTSNDSKESSSDSSESSLASTSYSSNISTMSMNNLRITSEEGFSQVNEVIVIPITKSDNLDDAKGFKDSNTENYSGTNSKDSNCSTDDSHDDHETNDFKTDFSEGHVVVGVIVVIVVFVIVFMTVVARTKGMLCFRNKHTEKFSLNSSAIEKGEFARENEMGDFEYNEKESKRSTLQL